MHPVIQAFLDFWFSWANAFTPAYLFATLALGCLIWLVRRKSGGLVQFLFPQDIYRHASTKVDAKVSAFNLLVVGLGLLPVIPLSPLFAYIIGDQIDAESNPSVLAAVIVSVMLVLGEDLARYLNHFIHHKSRFLWPFHAVHHSAEVLTPITYWRAHPVYFVIQQALISVILGGFQALAIWFAFGAVQDWAYATPGAVWAIYFLTGAHLRHSHIWLSYGPVLERVLISPAQHQIHHSIAPHHRDKNFGEIFAIWDWLFGTIYVPKEEEALVFGLGEADGTPISQPYEALTSAMLAPFAESMATLRRDRIIEAGAEGVSGVKKNGVTHRWRRRRVARDTNVGKRTI